MKKKYIYIILIITLTVAALFLLFFYFKKNYGQMTVNTGKEKIKVNDVYKNPVEIFPNSDVEYKKTADYYFDYYANNQLFVITLTNRDIKTARENAEKDFLNTLQISKEQACKLNIQLGVPFSINEAAAGKNYGLSFCPNGKPF